MLLFEGLLLCRASEEHGEIFTLLTEILIGGVTLSIPNGAEFAAFTLFVAFTCLTSIWFPSINRVKRFFLSFVFLLLLVLFGTFSL